MTEERNALHMRVRQLEESLAYSEEEKERLQAENEQLRVEGRVRTLEEKLKDSEESNISLTRQVNALETKGNERDTVIGKLKEQEEALTERIVELEEVNKKLRAENEELRRQNATLSTEFDAFKKETREKFAKMDAALGDYKRHIYLRQIAAKLETVLIRKLIDKEGPLKKKNDRLLNVLTFKTIEDTATRVNSQPHLDALHALDKEIDTDLISEMKASGNEVAHPNEKISLNEFRTLLATYLEGRPEKGEVPEEKTIEEFCNALQNHGLVKHSMIIL